MNRDPIEEKGGLNLSGFVLNSSINQIDVLGLALSGNITKGFTLALGSVLPLYKATLSVCWSRENTCFAGCGMISAYAATLVTAAYSTCMAANAINPFGWVACKVAFAKALSLVSQMDSACKIACKKVVCCNSGSNSGKRKFGDPNAFSITITL